MFTAFVNESVQQTHSLVVLETQVVEDKDACPIVLVCSTSIVVLLIFVR